MKGVQDGGECTPWHSLPQKRQMSSSSGSQPTSHGRPAAQNARGKHDCGRGLPQHGLRRAHPFYKQL